MKLTQADYDFYTINFNDAFFERAKNEKETLGELKIELEVMANYIPLLAGPVKIDCLVMPKKTTLSQPQEPAYKQSDLLDKNGFHIERWRLPELPKFKPLEGFAFDTIDTLEIPKSVKKIAEQTFFDFESNIFNKIWKLNRLILPSTGLTEISDLSFAGLMPKEIFIRQKDDTLTEASKRFKIIQGAKSGRSDGVAILIDLKNATQLIPSSTTLHEYKILEKEFPKIASEWKSMPYEDFVKVTLLCNYFSTPYTNHSYEHRSGKNYATLNELKNAVFNLKPSESPDGEFMKRNQNITKEIFEQISHYSKQVSDAILANRIEEEFIKTNRHAESFFDEKKSRQASSPSMLQKDMPLLSKEKFKLIKEAQEKIASEEQEFRTKYFIACLKELSEKHNLLLHATVEKEPYSSLHLNYEIIKSGIFIEKQKIDLGFERQFMDCLEKLQKKLEALL